MLKFLNENAGALTVLFSLVVTGATVVYAWLTAQLVLETRRMRRAQSDPKIALGLAPHQFRFGFVDLLIVNEGAGSAHDVTFEVHADETADPELVQKLQDYGLMKRGLKHMSPRQEVRTFFASMIERDERRMNTNIDVNGPVPNSRRRTRAESVLPRFFSLLGPQRTRQAPSCRDGIDSQEDRGACRGRHARLE